MLTELHQRLLVDENFRENYLKSTTWHNQLGPEDMAKLKRMLREKGL